MSDIHLTPREQEILDILVSTGASNKVIARELGISEATVKLYISNIIQKYYVNSRLQLVSFILAKRRHAHE